MCGGYLQDYKCFNNVYVKKLFEEFTPCTVFQVETF